MVFGVVEVVMPDLRYLAIPGVLLAVAVGFIVANLSGAEVDAPPTPTPTQTRAATWTPAPTRTPAPTFTPSPSPTSIPVTLDLSGTLIWQDVKSVGYDLVAIAFPAGNRVSACCLREPEQQEAFPPSAFPPSAFSPSRARDWQLELGPCVFERCEVSFVASDGRTTHLDGFFELTYYDDFIQTFAEQWAPGGRSVAFSVPGPIPKLGPGAFPPRHPESIVVVPDVSAPEPVIYRVAAGTYISTFAWLGDELVVAEEDDGPETRFAVVTLDGTRRELGAMVLAEDPFFMEAVPGTSRLVLDGMTASGEWSLMTLDGESGAVTEHGPIWYDQDPFSGRCEPDRPQPANGPNTRARFAGFEAFVTGSQSPYVLKVVDLRTDEAVEVAFPSGNPNNIAGSPDGAMIAVETYNPAQDHYEAWVVDPATGEQRYLLEGCRPVWSPDSRFLAVRAKDCPASRLSRLRQANACR